MADSNIKLIDLEGLKTYAEESKKQFAPQTEVTELKDEVSRLKLEGGEPNVIEHITVNGQEVAPESNKTVNLQIPKNVSELEDSQEYVKTDELATELDELTYVKEDQLNEELEKKANVEALEGFFSEPDVATSEDISEMLSNVFKDNT